MLQGERASSLCRSQYLKSSSKSQLRNYVLSIRRVRFPRLSTHCILLSFALYDAGTTSSFSKESGTLLNEQSGVDAHYVIDQESLSWALERPEAELPDKFIKFIKSKSLNQDDKLQAYDFFKKNDASVSNDRDLLNATWNETRNTEDTSPLTTPREKRTEVTASPSSARDHQDVTISAEEMERIRTMLKTERYTPAKAKKPHQRSNSKEPKPRVAFDEREQEEYEFGDIDEQIIEEVDGGSFLTEADFDDQHRRARTRELQHRLRANQEAQQQMEAELAHMRKPGKSRPSHA